MPGGVRVAYGHTYGPAGSDIKAVAAATYAATADHFDDPVLSFWDRFGRQTVARVGLCPGDRVLDACCGTGASALPAALVGTTGQVLGIDVAEPALTLARAKAHGQGLANVDFRAVDVEHTGLPSESFERSSASSASSSCPTWPPPSQTNVVYARARKARPGVR